MTVSPWILRSLELCTLFATVLTTIVLLSDVSFSLSPPAIISPFFSSSQQEEPIEISSTSLTTALYPIARSVTNTMGVTLFSITNVITIDDVNLEEVVLQEEASASAAAKAVAGGASASLSSTSLPIGIVLAFVWTVGSSLMTIWLVLNHLLHYNNPTRQRYIVRILLMVPIYAVDSYWCYVFYHEATWISIARDTYEAYVLYNFFALLMDYVGGEEGCAAAWKQEHFDKKKKITNEKKNHDTDLGYPTMPHSFPMNYLMKPMRLNQNTLWWWKFWLVQYMLLSPIVTLLSFLLAMDGLFEESSYALDNAHIYLMILKTASVTVAFTALFYLYLSTHDILHHVAPTAKFISIKFVIFFSFWQYLVLSTLSSYGYLPDSAIAVVLQWSHLPNSEEDHVNALCNLLLLVEMFITSLLHMRAFAVENKAHPHRDGLHLGHHSTLSFWRAARHAFSVRDIFHVTKGTAKGCAEKLKEN